MKQHSVKAGAWMFAALVALSAPFTSASGQAFEGVDDNMDERASPVAAANLPLLTRAPNIAAAAAGVFGTYPTVRAVYRTESGFQIYRCDRDATTGNPVWALRTPLAHLAPAGRTYYLLRSASNLYHMRSDFGGLVNDAEQIAMGLLANGTRATAPVWQFTYSTGRPTSSGDLPPTVRRETVAGRVLAQDAPDRNAIPWLLVQVRGRAVTQLQGPTELGTTNVVDPRVNAIAASEYILRVNTRGGVAPAATACNSNTLGTESQRPYFADYYFVDVDAPTGR